MTDPLKNLTRLAKTSAREQKNFMDKLSMQTQAMYQAVEIARADVVVAVFHHTGSPFNTGIAAVKGAEILVGLGIRIAGLAPDGTLGDIESFEPRDLGRSPVLVAFEFANLQQVHHFIVAWGDHPELVSFRTLQEDDGGEDAIRNMRLAVTPAGLAWVSENHSLVVACLHDMK